MEKHFSERELDRMSAWSSSGMSAIELRRKLHSPRALAKRRAEHQKRPPRPQWRNLQAGSEGDARPPAHLDQGRLARRRVVKVSGECEVHWGDPIKAAQVPNVDRTTAPKNMKTAGFDIQWRPPRLKPVRGEADEDERTRLCNKLRTLPQRHWLTSVDAYIDCKDWPSPQNVRRQRYLNMMRVRGHLRTKGDVLEKVFTKPDKNKHCVNTGGNLQALRRDHRLQGTRLALSSSQMERRRGQEGL